MSDEFTQKLNEYRKNVVFHRRRLKCTSFLLALVGFTIGLWIRAGVFDGSWAYVGEQMDTKKLFWVISASTDLATANTMLVLAFLSLVYWMFLVMTRDRKAESLHGLIESVVGTQSCGSAPILTNSRGVLFLNVGIACISGLALTVLAALLDGFGGWFGNLLARVLVFPAVLWSAAAEALGVDVFVNYLLRDPGCFGYHLTYQARLASHYISSILPLVAFCGLVMWVQGRIRRRAGKKVARE